MTFAKLDEYEQSKAYYSGVVIRDGVAVLILIILVQYSIVLYGIVIHHEKLIIN